MSAAVEGTRPSATSRVSVAIENDYPVVIAGVTALLSAFSDRVDVRPTPAGHDPASHVDVIFFDTFAQRASSDRRLAELGAGTAKLVVFSWHTDPPAVDSALRLGARGYLSKSLSPAEIVEAVLAVSAGAEVVNLGRHHDHPAAGEISAWPGEEAGLTPREAEILALICQGLSNEEICAQAYIGINSLKSRIRSLYRKIGVTRRPQALLWATRHGFDLG